MKVMPGSVSQSYLARNTKRLTEQPDLRPALQNEGWPVDTSAEEAREQR